MGLLRYNFLSETIGTGCVDVTITYPSGEYTYCEPDPNAPRGPYYSKRDLYVPGMKFQTVYLLHGGSDDDTTLQRMTRVEYYAQKNNVMTVTAQVKDHFFVDTVAGFNYFTYMTEELPCVVQSLFASSPKREDNFVVGMAMGGNAALYLAMRRPDLYAACVDLSGGIGCSVDTDYFISQLKKRPMSRMIGAFGSDPDKLRDSEYDLGYYARKNKAEGIDVPQIFMGVGEQDFIRDAVRTDRDALRALGYDLTYAEEPGLGHDWDFWDMYIKKVFYEWLPLKRRAVYPEGN